MLALLMVSTFRYWSFKEVDFARRRPVETLLVVVLSVMVVATMHEVFLFLVFGGYAALGAGPSGRGRPAARADPGGRRGQGRTIVEPGRDGKRALISSGSTTDGDGRKRSDRSQKGLSPR